MKRDSNKGKYLNPEGSATWEYFATFSCALMIFCIGCMAGWNSPALNILMGQDMPFPLSSADASTLTASVSLGHLLSPILTPMMAAKLGRKGSLLATSTPTIVSWGLIAVTQDVMVLLVARFFAGLTIGLTVCLAPMYLGEIASAKLRGAIGMVCGTMINTGVLFMFVVVPFFPIRTSAYICLGIAAIAAFCLWLIPESPYFLANIGKIEEAEGALEKLRGKTDVSEELDLIKATVSRESDVSNGDVDQEEGLRPPEKFRAFKRLFTVSGNRKALLINLALNAAIYLGSYTIIMVYSQIIFQKMKTGVTAHTCTMIYASLQITCNVLTASVIDRLGRRPLILTSGLLSGVFLLAVGVYFYMMEYTKVDVSRYGIYALCAVFGNIIALNFGLMPLHHVILSEVLATEVKGLATCVIGIAGGLMSGISVKSYLTLAETWRLGHSLPFFGFAAITWTCTGFILKMLPETKGRTLFEIQKDLNA